MPNPAPQYPIAIPLSQDVTAYVGYKDDRVRIEVDTGIPLVRKVNLWMVPSDLVHVERVVALHKAWMAQPQTIRFLYGAKAK
jgi:hypothetical protein